MAHFTFDTAYIVAHLQNNANEALKERIVARDIERRYFSDYVAQRSFAQFEIACAIAQGADPAEFIDDDILF